MTIIQPSARWVSIKLSAAARAAMCTALVATAAWGATSAAWAGTAQAAPTAHAAGISPAPQDARAARARAARVEHSVAVAQAAAVRTLGSRTRALQACRRRHPRHCATVSRAVARAKSKIVEIRARWSRWSRQHQGTAGSNGGADSSSRSSDGSRSQSGDTEAGGSKREAGGSESNGGGTSTGGGGADASSSGTGSAGSTSGDSKSGSSGSTSSGSTSPGSTSGGSTSGGSSSSPFGTGTPAPVEEPTATSDPDFEPGLNSGWDLNWDVPAAAKLGAKLVRIDMSIEDTPQEIETIIGAYAEKGIRVVPLADFHASMPTPTEAQDLGSWAKTFGPGGSYWKGRSDGQFAVHSIEFGNETSYSYQYKNDTPEGYATRAQTYALRFKEAALAIRAEDPGVGLLAQGDSGNAGPLWVENMFKAVPNLGELVAGWTIHPYGPTWRHRLEEVIDETAAQGAPSTIPIDITEWGISTDNGQCVTENFGWNKCMTYQEAGEALTRSVREMHEMLGSRFGMFLLYKDRDQQQPGATDEREAYFGALGEELQPKGPFTTATEEVLAS